MDDTTNRAAAHCLGIPWSECVLMVLFLANGSAFGQILGIDDSPAILPDIKSIEDLHRPENEAMPAPPRRLVSFPRPTLVEAQILERLDDPTTINRQDATIDQIFAELEKLHDIEIWMDTKAMAAEGLNPGMKLSAHWTNLSLRKSLELLLQPQGMNYLVEDNILKITTESARSSKIICRVYPVGDLVETPEDATQLQESIECGLGRSRLSEGPRHVAVSARAKTLIVRDTYPMHDRVQNILFAMQDAQQSQASVKTASEQLPRGGHDASQPKK